MTDMRTDGDELMLPSEVAQLLRVNAKTVSRWAKAGRLKSVKTIGGHRRFRRADVEAALAAIPQD